MSHCTTVYEKAIDRRKLEGGKQSRFLLSFGDFPSANHVFFFAGQIISSWDTLLNSNCQFCRCCCGPTLAKTWSFWVVLLLNFAAACQLRPSRFWPYPPFLHSNTNRARTASATRFSISLSKSLYRRETKQYKQKLSEAFRNTNWKLLQILWQITWFKLHFNLHLPADWCTCTAPRPHGNDRAIHTKTEPVPVAQCRQIAAAQPQTAWHWHSTCQVLPVCWLHPRHPAQMLSDGLQWIWCARIFLSKKELITVIAWRYVGES